MRTRAEWKRDALEILDSISAPREELQRMCTGGPGCLLERMSPGGDIYQEADTLWGSGKGQHIGIASDLVCRGVIELSSLRRAVEALPE